jgi:hypothetical protein
VTELPALGSVMRFRYGLAMVEGEVIEVYEGGSGPHVVLRINASGMPEYPIYRTLALPLEWVTAA